MRLHYHLVTHKKRFERRLVSSLDLADQLGIGWLHGVHLLLRTPMEERGFNKLYKYDCIVSEPKTSEVFTLRMSISLSILILSLDQFSLWLYLGGLISSGIGEI